MNIKVKFSEIDRKFVPGFSEIDGKFTPNFGEIQTITEFIGGEKYYGDYTVTPKVESQTMPTKGKVMEEDVTIKSIPFFNVSNTSGGSTVYIGKEV